ncbi:MAG TPA: phosphomannomutase/phosphoglucomutase [Nitrococcus sp.]|nr:phosphomannomutase/phosphoglucomutase [Nitrococcus sp.]
MSRQHSPGGAIMDRVNRARRQAAAAAGEPSDAKGVTGYFLAASLIAVILLLATLVIAALLEERAKEARWQEIASHTAELIGNNLAARVASIDRALAAEAKLEVLQKALRNHDRPALTELAQMLRTAFPLANRLMIVPKGTLAPDPSATPPIGYALLDMVEAAAAGRRPMPEVHLPGQPAANVNLVEPVRDGDAILGTLVLTFPAGRFFQWITPPPHAWINLQQHSAGGLVGLLELGNHQAVGPRIELAVPGTAWQLEYISGYDVDPLAETGAGLAIAVIVTAIVLILLTAIAFGARLRQALAADGQTLARLVQDGITGQLRTHYSVRLRELQAVVTAALSAAARAPAGSRGKKEEAASDSDSNLEIASASALQPTEVTEIDPPSYSHPQSPDPAPRIDPSILRAYDIRGVVGKALTAESVRWLGLAIGSEAAERGQQAVVVGYDGRHSSPELAAALSEGLVAAGRHVIDIGRVPTPVVYFAAHHLDTLAGVVVTGSHNPPEYNGLKVLLGGETLYDDGIQALGRRIETGDLHSGNGRIDHQDVLAAYQDRVLHDVALHRPLRVVVDCGNGVAGEIAPALIRALGCEVVELFCEVDGGFPNHHPDPTVPENLAALTRHVRAQHADLGLAFDGDGDRLGVVDDRGKIIWADRQLMLFAEDILSRSPGSDIVFDIKCTSRLADVITGAAGVPVLWKTGHSLIKSKLRETGAPLGGEMSGHIFFNDHWYGFDDGVYAAARLLEILSMDPRASSEVFGQLPEGISTPELRLGLAEGEPPRLMAALLEQASFGEAARVTTIDGLRVDFPDGWGLVRASNTQPCLVLRFEGNDQAALERIKATFRELIERLRPGLALPF